MSHWVVESAVVLRRDVRRLGVIALTAAAVRAMKLLPLIVALSGGCANWQTASAKVITGAETTLLSLKTGLVDYDKLHQSEIVDEAATRAEYDKRITAYRFVRSKLILGVLDAQHLLVAAQAVLMLASDPTEIVGPVADLLAAVTKLAASFASLRAPPPSSAAPPSAAPGGVQ